MTALINPFWYAVATDPYFASVVLLMHFDGANGTNTFVDSSLYNHIFSASASGITHTTAQQKFGSACLQNTLAGAFAATSDSADWYFAAGQFTIEAWIRPTATVVNFPLIVAQFGSGGTQAWGVRFNGNAAPGFFDFMYSQNGSTLSFVSAAYLPAVNTWTHIAVDRDASNVLRIYADGVVLNSATVTATIFNSTNGLTIANDSLGASGFIGQIDDLRITKGVARYAGAFTPPTAAFPNL